MDARKWLIKNRINKGKKNLKKSGGKKSNIIVISEKAYKILCHEWKVKRIKKICGLTVVRPKYNKNFGRLEK